MKWMFLSLMLLLDPLMSSAQGVIDQDKVEPLLNSQIGSVSHIERVNWVVYDYRKYRHGDKSGPWTTLQRYLDSLPGNQHELRLEIVELANRVTSDKLRPGRNLVVPTSFPDDYRAFSPYPFYYSNAASIPKLFIIDKFTQTFGAYESGELVRWGILSSGRRDRLTPNGKYNFHWKAEYRQSSAAPPGEVWEMYFMFNFYPKIGLHVHQYALPIAYPVSHGCVRVAMADAIWNYHWAEGTTRNQKGTAVWVINHNPKGKAAHWKINSAGMVESLVQLPGYEEADKNIVVQSKSH